MNVLYSVSGCWHCHCRRQKVSRNGRGRVNTRLDYCEEVRESGRWAQEVGRRRMDCGADAQGTGGGHPGVWDLASMHQRWVRTPRCLKHRTGCSFGWGSNFSGTSSGKRWRLAADLPQQQPWCRHYHQPLQAETQTVREKRHTGQCGHSLLLMMCVFCGLFSQVTCRAWGGGGRRGAVVLSPLSPPHSPALSVSPYESCAEARAAAVVLFFKHMEHSPLQGCFVFSTVCATSKIIV